MDKRHQLVLAIVLAFLLKGCGNIQKKPTETPALPSGKADSSEVIDSPVFPEHAENSSPPLAKTEAVAGPEQTACENNSNCHSLDSSAVFVPNPKVEQRQAELEQASDFQDTPLLIHKIILPGENTESGLEVTIQNKTDMFKVGSAELTPEALNQLESLAKLYSHKPQTLFIIGHSDAIGNKYRNQLLSERRAHSVARLFARQGITEALIHYQGAGEYQPIASNKTKTGRAQNRRVEIIELGDIESLKKYNLIRKSDPRFLKHRAKPYKGKLRFINLEKELKAIAGAGPFIDFSGRPARRDTNQPLTKAGEIKKGFNLSFSLFSKAIAGTGEEKLSPCYITPPPQTATTQRTRSGRSVNGKKKRDQSDFWPGLNGSVWHEEIKGHLIAIKDLQVLSKSGQVTGMPELLVYADYQQSKEIDFRSPASIETFPAENGLLIRSHFTRESPIRCMDILMPNKAAPKSLAASLYYYNVNEVFEKKLTLSRIKK